MSDSGQRVRSWSHFRPTDLSAMLSCEHLISLERRVHTGELSSVYYDDPDLELLRIRGAAHENAYLESLSASGVLFEEIAVGTDKRDAAFWARGVPATIDAMRRGVPVIYQAPLSGEGYAGIADFLMRVDTPSELGPWSYEALEAKLSSLTKATALLQLCLYSDLVGKLQGTQPEHMQVLPGGAKEPERYRLAEFDAYYRQIRDGFEAAAKGDARETYPEPVEHCNVCSWRSRCAEQRREDDHLSVVSRITRRQRRLLVRAGVKTSQSLSQIAVEEKAKAIGVARPSLLRLREQARIQIEGRGLLIPKHELLEVQPSLGLNALPEPSEGDVFLDFEGDHYAAGGGLEYLFGLVTIPSAGGAVYKRHWAYDRTSEKAAFEWLIDFLDGRDFDFPGFHVYHYGAYEESAIKRLMYRHGVKDRQVDDFLRRELFVDLNRVVQQAVRASVESYSIKNIEKLGNFVRAMPLDVAGRARKNFLLSIENGDVDAQRAEESVIEAYNREDCQALVVVQKFLESLRVQLAAEGVKLDRPRAPDSATSKGLEEYLNDTARVNGALLAGFPLDEAQATPDQLAKRLLANLLEFHRREDNATLWQFFAWLRMSELELLDERGPLSGLGPPIPRPKPPKSKGAEVFRYSFEPQEHALKVGLEVVNPATRKTAGEVYELNEAEGWIELKRPPRAAGEPHPRVVIPKDDIVRTEVLRRSLLKSGEAVARSGLQLPSGRALLAKLLLRDTIPLAPTSPYLPSSSSGRVFVVQGPPGTGKTYTAARIVLEALDRKMRVGITAHSHRAICNFLTKLVEAGVPKNVCIAQAGDDGDFCGIDRVRQFETNADLARALSDEHFDVLAGSAWLWSRDALSEAPVDILFVDEAGQMSLANAMAICPAADALVLLGDPQQLSQPQKGDHPPGAGGSVLEHLLDGEATIPPNRGLFLTETYRLSPAICRFTSECFYEGRLRSTQDAHNQLLVAPAPFGGTGLRFVPVQHAANSSESAEEVEVVSHLVNALISAHSTWVNSDGHEAPLTLADLLIVAPYNAQVDALQQRLPDARVGTVDRFQGQEAPVVIYTMATSTVDDAPRGMDFILSANRFNVAISRARCVAFLVANPELLRPQCRSPDQMRLANAFCRFQEIATTVWEPQGGA